MQPSCSKIQRWVSCFWGDNDLIEIAQVTIYGLVLGSIIVLGAIGLTLTYGILNFANFAHGDMMTLGAYFALFFRFGLGWPLGIALVAAMICGAAVSVLIDKAVYSRLRSRGSITLLIASVGVALITRNVIRTIWGPDNQYYRRGIQFPIRWAGLRIKPDHLWILGVALVLVIGVHLFLRYTKIGKAMRAMADNMDLAMVTGIDTDRVVMWTWIIGTGLSVAAGFLLGLDTQLFPDMGWNLLLPIFAAVILGGIGSPYGAMAGGLIIGLTQELSTLFISTAYKPVVAFVIMIVILLIRPGGIFHTKGAVKL